MTGGRTSRAIKREVPSLAEMRSMDGYALQMLKTRAIEATQSIRIRIHKLEAGVYEPSDETSLSRTRAALLRWEVVPALIDSIQAEDEAGPRDEMRAMLIALYRSVGRMFDSRYNADACNDVRLHHALITNHINPERTNDGDSQEGTDQG